MEAEQILKITGVIAKLGFLTLGVFHHANGEDGKAIYCMSFVIYMEI